MYIKYHIIFGAVFSTLIFVLFPEIKLIGLLLIFLSSVLIDTDHYLFYIYKKKDWNLKRAYDWNMIKLKKTLNLPKKQRKYAQHYFFIFHGFELLLLLYIFSIYISDLFFFILIGASFHLISDILTEILYFNSIAKISIVHSFFKYKKYKN